MPQQQQQNSDKFWNFIPGTETKPPELLLYGTIASSNSWFEDRCTPKKFNEELDALGEPAEIIVRINSGGGDVFAANAIFTRLKDTPSKITVKIDGWAASAATIIAMAGDTVKIAKNGVFMIHDPSMTVWDSYNAEDFRKMADELDVIKQSICNTYSMKTGRETEEIKQLMSEETWWTGEEAVENGFCDELLFENAATTIENSKKIVVNDTAIDISGFKTLPKSILNSSKSKEKPNFRTKYRPENKPKESEDKTMDEEIKTVEDLEKKYPELLKQIKDSAAYQERKRIKDIKNLEMKGFEKITDDAMFENPKDAAQVALEIINEQKKQGGAYLNYREKDAEDAAKVGADLEGKDGRASGENNFDSVIDSVFPPQK